MFVARRKMIRWNLRGTTLQNYEEVIIRRSNLCWDGRICENSSGSLDESITLDGLNTSRPFRVKDGERLVLRSSKSYKGNNEAKPKKVFTTRDWRINKMIVQVRHWCSLLHLSIYLPIYLLINMYTVYNIWQYVHVYVSRNTVYTLKMLLDQQFMDEIHHLPRFYITHLVRSLTTSKKIQPSLFLESSCRNALHALQHAFVVPASLLWGGLLGG